MTVSLCFVRNLEHQSAGASTYEATGTCTNEQLRESSRTEVYYCTVPQSDFGTVRLYEYTVPFLLRHTIKVETYLLVYVCSTVGVQYRIRRQAAGESTVGPEVRVLLTDWKVRGAWLRITYFACKNTYFSTFFNRTEPRRVLWAAERGYYT